MNLFIFLFFILNFIWMGNIIIMENYYNIWLFYLSFFIGLLINLSDKNVLNNILLNSLIIISFIFFFSYSMMILYIFFELSLIPIILMSMIFGMQIEKINSIYYLLMYSFSSSIPFLMLMFKLEFFPLFFLIYKFSYQLSLILLFLFLVKFPIYFYHFWLPKVHVEASTSASMILAGLLLKFGTQGIYRFMKYIITYNSIYLLFISIFGFLLGSFICLFQSDIKSLIAFSSIVHMSFLLYMYLNFSNYSKISCFILMIAHGFISTVIFFLVGEFLHYNLSRLVYFFNSMFINNIFFMLFFSLFLMLNSGFPPNLSFFSELWGFFINFNKNFYHFFIIILFMFFGFLFNFFLIINFNMGKNFLLTKFFSIFFIFSFFFMSLNFLVFL